MASKENYTANLLSKIEKLEQQNKDKGKIIYDNNVKSKDQIDKLTESLLDSNYEKSKMIKEMSRKEVEWADNYSRLEQQNKELSNYTEHKIGCQREMKADYDVMRKPVCTCGLDKLLNK